MYSPFILFLVTGLLGGTTGALVKYLVEMTTPLTVVAARFVVAVILISPFLLRAPLFKKALKNKHLIFGSVFFTANIALYAIGIQYTSLIMGQLLYVPTALIVAIIGYIFLKEKLNRQQITGLLLALIGMSILIIGSIKTSDVLSFGTPLGNILIGIGVLSWSAYTVISRKNSHTFKPEEITFINFSCASAITAIMILILYINGNLNSQLSLSKINIDVFLIAAAVVSLLFVMLFQLLIKKTSAFTSSLITYINPLIASVLGIAFFKEHFTPHLFFGGLLIMSAVFYSTTYQYIKRRRS